MEFLIFFVFWHKNSVIFREIFASGGGGKPDPKGFTEICLCDKMQMFIKQTGEENEQQRKKKKTNRTLENYRILSDHLRHCRNQLFVFFWPLTEI